MVLVLQGRYAKHRLQKSMGRTLNLKLIALIAFVGILNAVFSFNKTVSMVVVIIQLLLLLSLAIQRKWFWYGVFYFVFTVMSLEFSGYYGTQPIYGFRETKFFGIGASTIALMPLFAAGLFFSLRANKRCDSWYAKIFIRYVLSLCFFGLVVGLINIIINDHGVKGFENVFRVFAGEVYTFFILLFAPSVAFYGLFRKYPNMIRLFGKVVVCTFVGVILSQIFSFLLPFKGNTWDSPTLLVSFASFYSPLLLCFVPFLENNREKILVAVLGATGCLFSSIFAITSGGILVVLAACLGLLLIAFLKKQTGVLLVSLCLILIGGIFVFSVFQASSRASILFQYKMSQALSLFRFWEPMWFDNLPRSLRFRFEEFFNIFEEYKRNPFAFFLGKGIMGTCLDYNGSFYSSGYMSEGGAFTIYEWTNGTFYSMHESINVLFLSSGLMGIGFLLLFSVIALKHMKENPFLVVGLVYLFFHYTYSFTASTLGIVTLMLGLFSISRKGFKRVVLYGN